jgi:hypothetical protein
MQAAYLAQKYSNLKEGLDRPAGEKDAEGVLQIVLIEFKPLATEEEMENVSVPGFA